MKKDFGVKTWLYPMPVLMIATYNEDGSPNVMNAAWGGTGGEELLTVCIDNTHKTWANIERRKAFTPNSFFIFIASISFNTRSRIAKAESFRPRQLQRRHSRHNCLGCRQSA